MKYIFLFLIAFFAALSYSTSVFADPVYKVMGPDGSPIFTTEKPSANAKPADLPPINKGDMALPKIELVTCDQYGGIDCTAGPDSDGSVICYSGFKGATNRFRFSCNMPKLEVTEITPFNEQNAFSVFIRNEKSVIAQDPEIYFETPAGKRERLIGPKQIDAFGLEEYIFKSKNPQDFLPNEKVTIAQITVSCMNCP
jgi:hypothetical protein